MPANDPTSRIPARQVKTFDEIQFHKDIVIAALVDGKPYVAVPRLCRNIGVDTWGQSKKIQHPDNAYWASPCFLEVEGPNQSTHPTLCIPVTAVPFWLSSIKPSMVKEEAREKIKLYRKEVCQVLAAHYTPKAAAIEGNPFVAKKPSENQSVGQMLVAIAHVLEQQAQAYHVLEQQQNALVLASKDHEERLQQVETKSDKTDLQVTVLVEHRGRIMGIPALGDRGFHVPDNMQSQVGKQLCAIARARGDEPRSTQHKTPNGKFEVATYFPEVIDEWVRIYGDKYSEWRK